MERTKEQIKALMDAGLTEEAADAAMGVFGDTIEYTRFAQGVGERNEKAVLALLDTSKLELATTTARRGWTSKSSRCKRATRTCSATARPRQRAASTPRPTMRKRRPRPSRRSSAL